MSNLSVREQQAKQIIATKGKQITMLLDGDKSKASKYMSAMTQIALNPSLRNVDVESIVGCAFEIVQAGLNPNPLFGQAYVVPFKGKAQLQIGYKGWIALAYRNGWKVRAVPVYKCDEFRLEFKGLSDDIHFVPSLSEREDDNGGWIHANLVGVIVYAEDSLKNEFTEFVSFKKLEKLRMQNEFQTKEFTEKLTSKNGKQFDNLWYKWAEEMYCAKAYKKVLTRLPIGEQFQESAMAEDKGLSIEEVKDKKEKKESNPFKTQETIEANVVNNQTATSSLLDEIDSVYSNATPKEKALMSQVQLKYPNWRTSDDTTLEKILDGMYQCKEQ